MMSAAVAGPTFRPTRSYTTLRDVTRWDPRARAYLERKQAEGKSRREALRALKRHLARVVFRLLRAGAGDPPQQVKVRGGKVRLPVLA